MRDKKVSKNKVIIDETLFAQIAEGNDDAFRELYYATYRPVYAFLLSYTANHHDAEDLMQETYLKIKTAAPGYKAPGNPMAWILKIAKNIFLMKMRKEKNIVNVDYDQYANDLPLEQITHAEDRILIEAAFKCISHEERMVVIMHAVLGMKHREIADEIGRPLGTVLSEYNRAIRKMKKFIEQ